MSRFTFALYFSIIASILFAGCTASTYLMNTPEPSPEKEIQHALKSWKGTHISHAIQKWGTPHEIIGGSVGPKTYIWQVVVQTPAPQQTRQSIPPQDSKSPSSVSETLSSTHNVHRLVFYTRSNGVIDKTETHRNQNALWKSNWNGTHISQVIQEWGTPHGITDDGTDSKIYVWQIPVSELLPQTHGLHSITRTTPTTSDTYEMLFYTRPNGVIYKTLKNRELNSSVGSQSLHFSQEQQGSSN